MNEVEKLQAMMPAKEARELLRITCNLPATELSTNVAFSEKLKGNRANSFGIVIEIVVSRFNPCVLFDQLISGATAYETVVHVAGPAVGNSGSASLN